MFFKQEEGIDNLNEFKPAWWLSGPHLQTLWPVLVRRRIKLRANFERLELTDGDFLDLAWVGNNTGPIVIVLHGLNGSIRSPYVQGILQAISQKGWRGVLMHFRGCSGMPNRLARSYHSGETGDLQALVVELMKREPNTPLYAVGYSLGGNVLLKWLGECGEQNPLKAAVAVSVPFELEKSVDRLNKGFSRVYQWKLLRELVRTHRQKCEALHHPLGFKNTRKVSTFWEFDSAVTAPLHGFSSAKEYYQQSSSRQYLTEIQIPALILQAKNDPFTPASSIPAPHEISSKVTLELAEAGGHVGFVAGKYPWRPIYWLEQRIIRYLEEYL